MASPNITPRHAAIRAYYDERQQLMAQGVTHELAIREAFKSLLSRVVGLKKWTLVVEQKVEGLSRVVRPDGTVRDAHTLPRGYWEAKDTHDDLDTEIAKKFARGYPRTNIIFEDTRQAVLYQSGERVGVYDLTQPEQLATLLNRFLSYTEPNIASFEQAVERFKHDTPELARGLLDLITAAHNNNKKFQAAFAEFFELCRDSLNPNISREAVNEMLIQHLLTERLMRTVFENPDFVHRNVIAVEVEKVIAALTSRSFSRTQFLGQLDYFYEAIETAARGLSGFSERQTFINTVYEQFFQGYAVKVADTHGIVYTPQPIVDFMCAAVEGVLHDEFGLALHDPQVCIIDPCTGTGNFIINLLQRICRQDPSKLPEVYNERLFANEVMLLPYYVSSLNIEHAYFDLTQRYEPFEGLCFVDTLDLAFRADGQITLPGDFSPKNTERVERQQEAEITVIIGNPPYNVGQLNENDNNKNRKYPVVDSRVSETYARDSKATLSTKLYDPYVKFFRWATDRLQGRDGVVCFVSNNSFVDQIAFDGMRKHLLQDFTRIYHLDLHGNVRQNPKLSGTTHNVFGIQVGVGITVAVRSAKHTESRVYYYRVPENWRKEEKLAFLEEMVEAQGNNNPLNSVTWRELTPDDRNTWLVPEYTEEFSSFVPLGDKDTKLARDLKSEVIFSTFALGVNTARDNFVYGYEKSTLLTRMETFCDDYNAEIDRYRRKGQNQQALDDFLDYSKIKWSSTLKSHLERHNYAVFNPKSVRLVTYRPFTKKHLYYDRVLLDRPSLFENIFPNENTERENCILVLSHIGYRAPEFNCLATNHIADLHLCATTDGHQCFPFYIYDPDGTNRRENITDWALEEFRQQYGDDTITKWDIFYYVYGLLHHPDYRTRYADNLKRELPRIPYAASLDDFRAFSDAGRALADLHLNYETIEPYPLTYQWTPGKPVSYRVEKMRLTKDKRALKINEALTLADIPAQAFNYRLGNRSALEWVIDQYQVKVDRRSGIVSDPNQYSEDEKYIVELVGRVIAVSVQTVDIIAGLPALGIGETSAEE